MLGNAGAMLGNAGAAQGDTGQCRVTLGGAGLQALPCSSQHLFLLQDANVTGKPTITGNRLGGTVSLKG